ncbi:sulfite exporter TauE/SafE family protein, partial [Patulibacter sp. S7RM1-6]
MIASVADHGPSPWLALAILAAGFWAGTINVVVGSGTLVSFPVLVLCGYAPVVANVSNSIGLVAGSVSGAIGFRREIAARRRLVRMLLPASATGGALGAGLLLVLPADAFEAIVPVVVGAGVLLVVLGPVVQRRTARRAVATAERPAGRRVGAAAGVLVLGVYGGYFGAAQGILVVGLLGVLTAETLPALNAVKNLLVMAVNLVAAVVFLLAARDAIAWEAVALVALGAGLGGAVGVRVARRFPPALLRATIVVVGVIAVAHAL